jgi:hypothetical protein
MSLMMVRAGRELLVLAQSALMIAVKNESVNRTNALPPQNICAKILCFCLRMFICFICGTLGLLRF